MTVVVEERLVFKFGERWQVEHYDGHPDHESGLKGLGGTNVRCDTCGGTVACQREGCGKMLGHGSKVVDILGRYGKEVYFIEVKDYRERGREENPHLREQQKRLGNGELAVDVAIKVRDTLASVIGALHQGNTDRWQPLVKPLLRPPPPKVVLWLEEDSGSDKLCRAVQDQLRQATRWLNPHAEVMNLRTRELPGFTVSNLSDRVFALRACMKGKKKDERWISLEEFCQHMIVTPQVAREKLGRLEQEGFLKRAKSSRPFGPTADRFAPGTRWAEFHEEPA